ncbi:hypothetical protein [Escherichia coli]|uniref:hypothetical protein n=1 Tax=Escherichia coli TaxID=562 RepID=UPI0024ADD9B4|nr:hypothetical protein [Escherichia coli]WHG14933.1 hypothetical protein QDY31_25690 [Escherichia coli]WHG24167.1 hypothetical protein QDX00_25120 [Escherichia coli]
MTSLKTSIKTITYLSDIGCLEIQGASLSPDNVSVHNNDIKDSANNTSGITVSITASKICAGQKEFDAFLKLAEKLRENPTGN